METFVGYFLFWFYFVLIMLGVALSVVCAVLGGITAYDAYDDNAPMSGMVCVGGICAAIVGSGSLIGCMLLSKFVLNPIFRSLPDLF